MAQIARNTADKATTAAKNATDNVAEAASGPPTRRPRSCARPPAKPRTPYETASASFGKRPMPRPRSSRKPSRRAGAGMAELNRALLDLLHQQTRDNVQLVQALAQPANWGQAAQLQSEFLRASFQRTAQFTQRYVEVGQAVLTSALSTAQRQAGKSA